MKLLFQNGDFYRAKVVGNILLQRGFYMGTVNEMLGNIEYSRNNMVKAVKHFKDAQKSGYKLSHDSLSKYYKLLNAYPSLI